MGIIMTDGVYRTRSRIIYRRQGVGGDPEKCDRPRVVRKSSSWRDAFIIYCTGAVRHDDVSSMTNTRSRRKDHEIIYYVMYILFPSN